MDTHLTNTSSCLLAALHDAFDASTMLSGDQIPKRNERDCSTLGLIVAPFKLA